MELTIFRIDRDAYAREAGRCPVFPRKCKEIYENEDGTVTLVVDLLDVGVDYRYGYIRLQGTMWSVAFMQYEYVKVVAL